MPTWLVTPLVGVVLRRVVPPLVGAMLGLLADAGLLDGALVDALRQILSAS